MSDSDATDATHGFGSGMGDDEVARLELQDQLNAQATRIIFTEAGIRPGMRVLDLGCGPGGATFVAADLVGPGGSVTGVDHSPDALARARLRAGRRGLARVQFIEGDVHDPAPGGPYDAIVERLTLWTVPDPAEVLRRQATVLRPGGLIVPVESDLAGAYSEPEVTTWTQFNSWMVESFAKAGLTLVGRRLRAILEEAGLRPLGMIGIQPHVLRPADEAHLATWMEGLRNLVPVFVSTGVATAEEVGVETWAQRVRDEWERTHMVLGGSTTLGAWATTSPE
jgi:ubiquinone/menaquinone biosynthesis C-methylase UbiE